jgi:hypothetical protein
MNQRPANTDKTTEGIKTMMRAVQVTRAKGPFELVEREIPQPAAGQVRIKVEACGVCHSDAMTKEGLWPPGIQYPRVPGHEIAGVIGARHGGCRMDARSTRRRGLARRPLRIL